MSNVEMRPQVSIATVIQRNFPLIAQLLEEHGSVLEIRKAIDEKQKAKN